MSLILMIFAAFSALAQNFQYRTQGSYQITPTLNEPTTINYVLNWNETSTDIQGVYQDNLFTRNVPMTMTGTIGEDGRTFNVILPEPLLNVKQIRLVTPQTGSVSGTITMQSTTLNSIGAVQNTQNGSSLMTVLPTATLGGETPDADGCTIGFGSLTGLCGLYGGVFNEVTDSRNRCDILSGGETRMDFGLDTSFRMVLNYIPGGATPQVHNIGALLPSPTASSINVTSRFCGPLPGTTFIPLNCKQLNLSGVFVPQVGGVNFTGTYLITDEVTAESCSYSMSLNREVTY